MGSDKSWAAIGAIAGIAGACIALLAYADDISSAPPATTTPAQTREVPDIPPPEPEPTTSPTAPVPTTSRRTDTTPPSKLPLPSQLPLGCEDAFAAIDAYHRSAGSTTSSQAAAASQAHQSLMRVSLDNYGGPVYSITRALSQDFQKMWYILMGFAYGDYATAVAATNSDIDTLRTVCAPR